LEFGTETGEFRWVIDHDDSGSYIIKFFLDDGGDTIAERELSFIIAKSNRVPIIDDLTNITANENDIVEFVVKGSDEDKEDVLKYSLLSEEKEFAEYFDTKTGVFKWQTTNADSGNYKLILSVSDGETEDTTEMYITIGDVDRPPFINIESIIIDDENQTDITNNISMDENSKLEIMLSISDPDGDLCITSVTDIHKKCNFDVNSNMITWKTTYEDEGVYEFIVNTDSNGQKVAKSIKVNVNDVNILGDQAPVLDGIGEKTFTEGEEIEFNIFASDPDGDEVQIVVTGLPDGAEFDSLNWKFTWQTNNSNNGEYKIIFTASANGESVSEIVKLTVLDIDREPYLIALDSIKVKEKERIEFQIGGGDPDGDELTFSMENLPTGANFDKSTKTFVWQTDFSSYREYIVNAKIEANGKYKEKEKEIEIEVENTDRAPYFYNIENQEVEEGNLAFDVNGVYPENDDEEVVISVYNLPDGAIFSGNSFSWTPDYDMQGNYELLFTITSNGLSDSENVVISVGDVDRPPKILRIEDYYIYENEKVEIDITASDPDGETTVISVVGDLPVGAKIEGSKLSWTPDYTQDGDYEIIISADSNELSDKEKFIITVFNKDRSPVIDESDSVEIKEGETLSKLINTNDPDGDKITWFVEFLPEGATFDNEIGKLYWEIDYDSAGSYDIAVNAEANGLIDKKIITLEVEEVDRLPIIEDLSGKSVMENRDLIFYVVSYDPDSTDVEITTENLPEGATFDKDTMQFNWKPTYSDKGVYTVSFISKSNGLTTQEDLVISVGNVDRPPILSPIGNRKIKENSAIIIEIKAIDYDQDIIDYKVEGIPDGAMFKSSTNEFIWNPDFDDAGIYQLEVTVSANGESDKEIIEIVVENVDRSPDITELLDVEIKEGAKIEFTIFASDPDSDEIDLSCINLPNGAEFNSSTGKFVWSTGYSDSGNYQLVFKAESLELFDIYTAVIDIENVDRSPEIKNIEEKIVDENKVIKFTVSAIDLDGDKVKVSAENLPTGSMFNETTKEFYWKPNYDDYGEYTLQFTGEANGVSDTESVKIVVENIDRSPVVTSSLNYSVDEDKKLEFVVVGKDLDGDSIEYKLESLPEGSSYNYESKIFEWTPSFEDSGVYILKLKLKSNELSDEKEIKITVNNVDRAPMLNVIGDIEKAENSNIAFTILATDLDGDNIKYSVIGLPIGAEFNTETGAFNWDTTYSDASVHNLEFSASSNDLVDKGSTKITVNNVDRAPVISDIPSKSIYESEEVRFTVEALDPDGDDIIYSVAGVPEGAIFDSETKEFNWKTGYDSTGRYTVTFKAVSKDMSDSIDVLILIGNVDRAPVITSDIEYTVSENSELTFVVTGTDSDGDNIIFSLDNIPIGAEFNSEINVFKWKPDYDSSGEYKLSTIAKSNDLSDSSEIKITVKNTDRAPILTSIGNKETKENTILKFTVEAVDLDGDNIIYSATDLPTGATFDSSTRLFEWNIGYSDTGIYIVEFKVESNGLTDNKYG